MEASIHVSAPVRATARGLTSAGFDAFTTLTIKVGADSITLFLPASALAQAEVAAEALSALAPVAQQDAA